MNHYILDNENNPIVCDDLGAWTWREQSPDRVRVSLTRFHGGVYISTVFLTVDHNILGLEPHLWETVVYGGAYNGYQNRYATYDDAVLGHLLIIRGMLLELELAPVLEPGPEPTVSRRIK